MNCKNINQMQMSLFQFDWTLWAKATSLRAARPSATRWKPELFRVPGRVGIIAINKILLAAFGTNKRLTRRRNCHSNNHRHQDDDVKSFHFSTLFSVRLWKREWQCNNPLFCSGDWKKTHICTDSSNKRRIPSMINIKSIIIKMTLCNM